MQRKGNRFRSHSIPLERNGISMLLLLWTGYVGSRQRPLVQSLVCDECVCVCVCVCVCLTPFFLAPISLLAGDLGMVNVTFLSRSTSLCIKFSSDTLTELIGFNATYTKLYNNTNITGQSSFKNLSNEFT